MIMSDAEAARRSDRTERVHRMARVVAECVVTRADLVVASREELQGHVARQVASLSALIVDACDKV